MIRRIQTCMQEASPGTSRVQRPAAIPENTQQIRSCVRVHNSARCLHACSLPDWLKCPGILLKSSIPLYSSTPRHDVSTHSHSFVIFCAPARPEHKACNACITRLSRAIAEPLHQDSRVKVNVWFSNALPSRATRTSPRCSRACVDAAASPATCYHHCRARRFEKKNGT
jgi:hypothetical protein